MSEAYAHISPTAKLVVELRRYSDVPFAEDIARAVGSAEAMAAVLDGEPFAPGVLSWMAPLTEARYKSLTAAIARSGAPQVLELRAASRFAARRSRRRGCATSRPTSPRSTPSACGCARSSSAPA